MTEEWLCDQIEKLKIEENCLSTLTEIRERLRETPTLDANFINHLLSSPEIYNCLGEDEIDDATNRKRAETVRDILSKCLEKLSFKENPDLHHLLRRGLTHKQSRIKNIFLDAILRELMEDEYEDTAATDIVSLELLHYILLAVHDLEESVGSTACKILRIVLENYLDEPAVKNSILETLKKNAIVKCRLYELAVKIAEHKHCYLANVEFILDHALSELDNDDMLVKVNILEILVTLAEFKIGIWYLDKRQVFEVLAKRVEGLENNRMDHLLVPGIMKFFGKISVFEPEKVIVGYPHMIHCLFSCLDDEDSYMLPTAYDTLVNLTHTEHGVYLLDTNYPNEMKYAFEKFAAHLRKLPLAWKTRAMYTLTHIFSIGKEEVLTEISEIFHRWFIYLNNGVNNMHFLMLSCRIPIAELSYSTFYFIRAICYYPWGIAALKNTGGFLEFLLDRTASIDEGTKYIKFTIISLLASSDAFDLQTSIQLRRYVNEGAFFVPRDVDVAAEENQ